ncbi:uncharacterized protein LOC110729192 [Chenopodium quinoa]|uniref:uncharacterized protein LOC110729192 n=1 Tax=Chenopodium quinoa TaxID=63459 RepID=UPI000B78057E|nr:uncharacterized protein LOC110729192 [Chenopodium quinoa]
MHTYLQNRGRVRKGDLFGGFTGGGVFDGSRIEEFFEEGGADGSRSGDGPRSLTGKGGYGGTTTTSGGWNGGRGGGNRCGVASFTWLCSQHLEDCRWGEPGGGSRNQAGGCTGGAGGFSKAGNIGGGNFEKGGAGGSGSSGGPVDAHYITFRGTIDEGNQPVFIKKLHSTNSFVGVEGIVREIVTATQMLKIGSEISYALAYLQNCFFRPVIFRNLSIKDVYFDKDYVAKLTGYYFSVLIPEGEDHVNDAVVGTTGGSAPEYISSGSMIVDPKISCEIEESGKQQQLQEVFELAWRCTYRNEDDRPSMIEVASELKKIADSN